MALVRIGAEPLDARDAEARVTGDAFGAVCTFAGVVRNNSRGRQVAFLEYDAYVPLAEKEMLRIAMEAEEKWAARVCIVHRIGRMDVGEVSVIVSAASAHRAEAFEACRWCIDTLKQTVPIWKRETCPDGAYWIEGEQALKAEDA